MILKTSRNTKSTIQLRKSRVWVSGNSKTEHDSRFELSGSEIDGNEVDNNEFEKKDQKTSKSKKLFKSKEAIGSLNFLTFGARLAFNKLGQVYIKVLILHHFNQKCYIQIKMDALDYAIGGIFTQLTLNDLGQWHLAGIFSQRMIPVKTRYETYNSKLLAIVETFKTWKHYSKDF